MPGDPGNDGPYARRSRTSRSDLPLGRPALPPGTPPLPRRAVRRAGAPGARLQPGDRLLEVGCATGTATIPLARRGYRITLRRDLGPAQVRAARRDALRMRVGWAIVWKRTPLVYGYLRQVGFRYGYGADWVNVYRLGSPLR